MSTEGELKVMQAMTRLMPLIRDADDYHVWVRQMDRIAKRAAESHDFDIAAAIDEERNSRVQAQLRVMRGGK